MTYIVILIEHAGDKFQKPQKIKMEPKKLRRNRAGYKADAKAGQIKDDEGN